MAQRDPQPERAVVHTDAAPDLVARRRIARLARTALMLGGLGVAAWTWLQVRAEFFDGFEHGPEQILEQSR
ncbi:MAG: hypothetical protein P3B98_04130 [Gemmatimonadota bacterium]|nr:hypothetical protein [Gemmatimonadota bacterium]